MVVISAKSDNSIVEMNVDVSENILVSPMINKQRRLNSCIGPPLPGTSK
jgi:hypothetical protein